jgi:hypothetical protein
MAENRVQLGSQVLPRIDTTVRRVVENPIPLGRLATLWEFALAIMPLVGQSLERILTLCKPKIHKTCGGTVRIKCRKVKPAAFSRA